MEKRNALFVVTYFAIGLFGGWLLGAMTSNDRPRAQNIKAEYYLELKKDGSAVLEDIGGNTYHCPKLEDIPSVLERDNL
jgi:hypothetical protein